ncbi:MAG: Rpn family recombination-promoting nuclease/putative transposase [Spirochaetaceae bacterium]|nr:Rpn family recombination-promoting nuclease/putative transposase [Spirochaetaceae bacterium]
MENQTTIKFKRWEDLDITDDFIFTRVMRNKRLCRTLLEMILKVKVGKIKFLTSHHAIQIDPNAKGIIMDVYLKDENKVINVEMQASNHGDLPRRARYYQAAADIDTTPKGSEYSDLKQNYVIFICTFDPFHKGKSFYTFQNLCIEHDEPIYLEDGTEKIFLNTSAKDLSNLDLDLRLFYDYIKGKVAQTAFTKELDESIARMKQEKEERNMYLTYTSRMMECRRDGYEEGLHTGREEGISIGLATGREEGISIGLEQGLERGAYQNKLETAQLMIGLGIPLEQVQLCTNLPLDVVQGLIQNQ